MSEKEEKRLPILLLMVLCLILSYQPMAYTGLTYWDVSTDWKFYSGTALNSGPVTFTAPFTTTNINPDGSLVKFQSFNMGDHWAEIGFKAPINASMLVTYVGSSEAHFVAQPVGGLRTFELYAPNKGIPANVSGGVSWSYSSGNDIVSVNADVIENIAVTWASTTVGIGSIGILPIFLGFMALVVILAASRRRR